MADPRAEIRELLVVPPQFRDEDRPVEGTFEAESSDVIREQAADDLLDAYRDQILHEAAERQRARGNEIAAAPPDTRLDPHAGVSFLVAEGWYQAADLIRPKEQP